MVNPYLGYGNAVYGERLVGRTKEVDQLTERILCHSASISIIGQRNVGKTSLIIETIRKIKTANPNFVIISVDMSIFPDSKSFFDTILEEIEEFYLNNTKEVPSNFEVILNTETNSDYESYRRCRRGFKALCKMGVNIKVVIDEFDAVCKFENAEQTIQWLRELIDKGYETGLSVVFISRRSLYAIEKKLVDVSNLDGICEKYYVKPLDDEGLQQMAQRCHNSWHISADEFEKLKYYTGGHPYLAEMILCHSYEKRSVYQGIIQVTSDIYDFYEHLRQLLSEDELFDQLLQIAVGPRWNLKVDSQGKLLRYGLIKEKKREELTEYKGWSEHFQNYLEKISREIPVWELWAQTEISLRNMIAEYCENSLGSDWTEKLRQRKNELPSIINACEVRMQKEQNNFGLNASAHWLDYTYPDDLWKIISWEWQTFQPLLQKEGQQKNKKYWAERFQLLAKIRSPFAHNRGTVVGEHELTLALAYCKEILSITFDKN